MDQLEKVRRELQGYEHLLLAFDVREPHAGQLELVIRLATPVEGAHEYVAPLHERDVAHTQFTWTFQRFLYDCIHDYMTELFTRNPQELEHRA
jgi:hypothetical protein